MHAGRRDTYYPQSNGKIERWHKSMKRGSIRMFSPSTLEEARKVVERFVNDYNDTRLHSAIGYITPEDRLHGRQDAVWAARDAKLEAARQRRAETRQAARMAPEPHAPGAGP